MDLHHAGSPISTFGARVGPYDPTHGERTQQFFKVCNLHACMPMHLSDAAMCSRSFAVSLQCGNVATAMLLPVLQDLARSAAERLPAELIDSGPASPHLLRVVEAEKAKNEKWIPACCHTPPDYKPPAEADTGPDWELGEGQLGAVKGRGWLTHWLTRRCFMQGCPGVGLTPPVSRTMLTAQTSRPPVAKSPRQQAPPVAALVRDCLGGYEQPASRGMHTTSAYTGLAALSPISARVATTSFSDLHRPSLILCCMLADVSSPCPHVAPCRAARE
jgi:hypothetical protein